MRLFIKYKENESKRKRCTFEHLDATVLLTREGEEIKHKCLMRMAKRKWREKEHGMMEMKNLSEWRRSCFGRGF